MSLGKRNICRRKYDELSSEFFLKINGVCQKYRYRKEDVDRSMKRLLKIAESRDPTPNDVSMSTSLANITKEHLESFFRIFCDLVERLQASYVITAEESANQWKPELTCISIWVPPPFDAVGRSTQRARAIRTDRVKGVQSSIVVRWSQ
ncbi:unnamed protein product [Heligmosomoides polygyrus]|uniref:MADF domain-containing protein n=1 Tax=Heligmosomoides polygyrus TaxID=6339 RepID=A0A183GEL0_HELPZ|nr:unnamed protein product [Heligmosomoides polygyrus]